MKVYEIEQSDRGKNKWFKRGWDNISKDKTEIQNWIKKLREDKDNKLVKFRIISINLTNEQYEFIQYINNR